jgi:hypothetical protein
MVLYASLDVENDIFDPRITYVKCFKNFENVKKYVAELYEGVEDVKLAESPSTITREGWWNDPVYVVIKTMNGECLPRSRFVGVYVTDYNKAMYKRDYYWVVDNYRQNYMPIVKYYSQEDIRWIKECCGNRYGFTKIG